MLFRAHTAPRDGRVQKSRGGGAAPPPSENQLRVTGTLRSRQTLPCAFTHTVCLAAPPAVDGRAVCSNRYTRIDANDLPLHQRDLFGSAEWHRSYARRGRVEGFFGNLKNDATESVQRGVIRVVGLYKTGLMLAGAAATNLRLTDTFRARSKLRFE